MRAWLAARAGILAAVMCGVYALALAPAVHRHVVGVFSDFYRFYAPDADRIAAGELPRNTFNPPGYPLLLAAASAVTGNHFASGKWISLLAGALAGVLAFALHRRLFGWAAGLMAVPIMLSSPTLTTYAITAMTDVPFACMALAALLAITAPPARGARAALAAGALTGVAYLLRYNGAFLLAPGLAGALTGGGSARAGALTGGGPARARARRAAVYLGSALLVAAPWLWLNHVEHGSALYSTNFRDVAREHLPHVDAGSMRSLADVLAADPAAFARSYARHLLPTLANSFGASLALFPVGPLAALGMVLSLVRGCRKPVSERERVGPRPGDGRMTPAPSAETDRRRAVLLVLLAALAFLLFMALTHWERRYFLFLLACYSGFAAHAIAEIARGLARLLRTPRAAAAVASALMLVILVPSAIRSAQVVRTTLARQPLELLPAARFLDEVAPPGAPVMAVRAQIAYLSRRPWRETPDARSVGELRALLGDPPPAYLVYDRWGRFRAGLTALATPDPAVGWLRPVFNDGAVVIYAVEPPARRPGP